MSSETAIEAKAVSDSTVPVEAEAKAVKPKSPTLIWPFPGEAEQVFAGWNKVEQAFIFGCVMPQKVRDINYWPNFHTKKDVTCPTTVVIQYMPVFYGERCQSVQGTEISCPCASCQAWINHKYSPTTHKKPRSKQIHFPQNVPAQFGVYELVKKENKLLIRRLAIGNNKFSKHTSLNFSSLVCWMRMKRPANPLEAYSRFWSSLFSFSYTGKEKNLDNPDGYEDFLENYVKNMEELATFRNESSIDLVDLLKSCDPVLISNERHDGVSVDLRGYPRKTPKIFWADRDSDGWLIDGKKKENVEIVTSYQKVVPPIRIPVGEGQTGIPGTTAIKLKT